MPPHHAGEYPDEGASGIGAHEPRLFQISNALGALEASEVYNFTQDDLDTTDVFVLDTWTQMFVWVGHDANDTERAGALKAAQDFINAVEDGRDADTPIIKVRVWVQGSAPVNLFCLGSLLVVLGPTGRALLVTHARCCCWCCPG